MYKKLKIVGLVILAFGFVNCNKVKEEHKSKFGIFKVLEDGVTVEMNGDIKRSTLKHFNKLESSFPNINRINIKECGGSLDDETNLEMSKKVHKKGIHIHLMDNGLIASGGVDFFVAGTKRTKGKNCKIGVHAWAGDKDVATDYPVGHAFHLQYINYYVSVGFTQKEAEDFYYFTINSAPANSIHWMTDEEISKYKLITE